MDNAYVLELIADLSKAFGETFYMIAISLTLSLLFGVPLGLLLYVTDKGLFAENRFVNAFSGLAINVTRSTPFVILLVLVLPLTQRLIGTTIGPIAASVPLSIAAIAFYARLVQSSLLEVDKGVIEAAVSMGASPRMIIVDVLLSEGLPGLLRGLTITAVSLIGYSAMAGIVGGGGVGDLAIRFGYYRYQTDVMVITVAVLVILVQAVQTFGDLFAKKFDRL
ncbi:MAG TPA: methionine ABC transporter permease [Negativicutes bacterium]|nr:methionine ABC transporter permease [Negativicutes bacterium]